MSATIPWSGVTHYVPGATQTLFTVPAAATGTTYGQEPVLLISAAESGDNASSDVWAAMADTSTVDYLSLNVLPFGWQFHAVLGVAIALPTGVADLGFTVEHANAGSFSTPPYGLMAAALLATTASTAVTKQHQADTTANNFGSGTVSFRPSAGFTNIFEATIALYQALISNPATDQGAPTWTGASGWVDVVNASYNDGSANGWLYASIGLYGTAPVLPGDPFLATDSPPLASIPWQAPSFSMISGTQLDFISVMRDAFRSGRSFGTIVG